jgi:hypothetical protein
MRPLVLLLTPPDCHLCAHAREVLDPLAAEGLLRWRELDADSVEGARLAATAPPLRPVLFDATGHVIAYGRLSRRRLLRELGSTGSRLLSTKPEQRARVAPAPLSDPAPRASYGKGGVVGADATRISPANVGVHEGRSR